MTLVILALILAVIILVSKFVLGINFSLMEQGGYISFGYHEIRGESIWAMSFDSFSGSISESGTFPKDGKHRLLVQSGTGNTPLELEISCGDEEEQFTLDGGSLDLTVPGDSDSFIITVSGDEILSGYFSAVWE